MALRSATSPIGWNVFAARTDERSLIRFKKLRIPPLIFFAVFTIAIAIAIANTPLARARPASDSPRRNGVIGMPEPHSGSLLVEYYETYLKDQDIEVFRRQVASRYNEGTLARLVEASDVQARRAALLALGLFGSYSVNSTVAKALRDTDPTARRIADLALWSIWFRADTAENNAMLEQVRDCISKHRLDEAITLATRLIERSPQFAEAYNQRAIAAFYLGRFKESAADCEKVVERNPYHIGALSGLANCQIRLEKRESALDTLRRAAKLQPYNVDIRKWIVAIEENDR